MASPLTPPLPSLKRQLLGWFLLVSLLPMILLAIGLQWQLERELIKEKQIQLYAMAREKGRLVNETTYSVKVQLEQLATLPSLGFFLKDSKNLNALRIVTEYTKRFIEMTGHHDLLVINRQGVVVYSTAKESDLEAKLLSELWKDSPIGVAFDQTRSLMTTIVTPYRFYAPSQKMASFMATPIWNAGGEWLGVAMIQLNPDWLSHVSASPIGLSQTGEVVMAQHNQQGRLVAATPLRLDVDAQRVQRPLDEHHDIPANRAIRGDEGWGDGIDYRSQPVVAGWVYIPSLQMALVVKQETAEVLALLASQRLTIMLLVCLAVAFVAWMVWRIGLRLVAPIQSVVKTVNALSVGNWHVRIKSENLVSRDLVKLSEGVNRLADTIEEQLDRLQHQATELEYQAETLAQYNHDLEEAVAERTQELAKLSLIDPMTGLFNRRHYAQAGTSLWKSVTNQKQCLMFALLDVDYFKFYNDSRGHQMGDEALKLVGECLKQMCRDTHDLPLRMGGEEMALLMLVKHEQDALILAEHLRQAVEAKAITHPTSPVKGLLTVSIGVALLDARDCQQAGEVNLDGLYRLADEALYRAKNQGRNQVVLASEAILC